MSPEPLVIVGAGGFARETAELVRAVNAVEERWDLRGFLDDSPELAGTTIGGLPVLGPTTWAAEHDNVRLVVCMGTPRALDRRPAMVERLGLLDDRFATLVHPTAVLAGSVAVGAGTVIHATTVATADVTVGRHVEVMPACVLTHDDVIGDFATLGAGVRLAGGATVGRGAYVGSGVLVREGIDVGEFAVVGMGSVVTRDVPSGGLCYGVPARCR